MGSPACQWIRSVLAAYLDGELKASTAGAVRRHLAHCESCRKRAMQLEETWGLISKAGAPVVSADFTERMMARIVEEKALEALAASLRRHGRYQQVAAAVTGLAAGLVLGLSLYTWTGLTAEPASPVEAEVSRSVAFLEDAELLDEMPVVEAMDQLTNQQPGGGV
jgi:anti-sigma factor RsiW